MLFRSQILLPSSVSPLRNSFLPVDTRSSFIGDMAQPEDFPKGQLALGTRFAELTHPLPALYVSMAAEFVLFTLSGSIVYYYTGTEYTTAPAYGSLHAKLGKVRFRSICAFHRGSLSLLRSPPASFCRPYSLWEYSTAW